MSQVEKYILVTVAVIFVVVFARWLKRYLRRNEIQETFPYLFPFQDNPVSSTETIRIEMPAGARVKAEITAPNGGAPVLVFDEVLEKGIQSRALPVKSLAVGFYELRITFPNQVTTRKFRVA